MLMLCCGNSKQILPFLSNGLAGRQARALHERACLGTCTRKRVRQGGTNQARARQEEEEPISPNVASDKSRKNSTVDSESTVEFQNQQHSLSEMCPPFHATVPLDTPLASWWVYYRRRSVETSRDFRVLIATLSGKGRGTACPCLITVRQVESFCAPLGRLRQTGAPFSTT